MYKISVYLFSDAPLSMLNSMVCSPSFPIKALSNFINLLFFDIVAIQSTRIYRSNRNDQLISVGDNILIHAPLAQAMGLTFVSRDGIVLKDNL